MQQFSKLIIIDALLINHSDVRVMDLVYFESIPDEPSPCIQDESLESVLSV